MDESIVEEGTNYLTTTFIAGTLSYLLFYFYKVVHRPCLIGSDGNFKKKLNNLDILKDHYWPTFWAFSTHFQTICRVIFKTKPFLPYRREVLITPDDGHIGLDWIDNDDNNTVYEKPATRPIVIILPGITGCSDASYVRNVALEAKQLGCRVLVFNNRGLGNVSLKTPRTFCACNGEDLESVLRHVYKLYPDAPIMVFAVSLGGVIFTNYLMGRPKYLDNLLCVLAISLPWDSSLTTLSLEKFINWLLYNRFIVNKMKGVIVKNLEMFRENISRLPYQLDHVLQATTIREFDERFTSKTFGFATNEDYYDESSLSRKPLENIQVPMLFLNARDDPFAPPESIPLEKIKQNPNLAIILTDYGGHIGFIEGPTVRGRSFVERLFSQYVSEMLNTNNNKGTGKLKS